MSAPDRLAAELARIAALDGHRLGTAWRKAFGKPAPIGLAPAVMRRALACLVQAVAAGDLDRETARLLDRVAAGEAMPPVAERGRVPGTVLVREWQGSMHAVTVMERGYAWRGRPFDSLSGVAQAITGTSWNGPRFFGLRAKRAAGVDGGARP